MRSRSADAEIGLEDRARSVGIDRGGPSGNHSSCLAQKRKLMALRSKVLRVLAGDDFERRLDDFAGGGIVDVEDEVRPACADLRGQVEQRPLEAECNPAPAQMVLQVEQIAGNLALIVVVDRDERRGAGQWLGESAQCGVAVARIVFADDNENEIGRPDQRSRVLDAGLEVELLALPQKQRRSRNVVGISALSLFHSRRTRDRPDAR